MDSLATNLFNIYVQAETAEMNFDYETLKKVCSEELCSIYEQEMKELQQNHQKRIINNS